MPYNKETGILTQYHFYIEAIQVHFDCSWSEGSTVSLHKPWNGIIEQLFRKKGCPKTFRWKSRKPREIWHDIIIECVKKGQGRSDVVATIDDLQEMVERAEYNKNGQAHIESKHTFSFGTSISWFKVLRVQQARSFLWSPSIILEFETNDECLRFIDHDIPRIPHKAGYTYHGDDANILFDYALEAVIPLLINYCHSERAATDRGLSSAEFNDEFTKPETPLIRHQVSTIKNHTRPCLKLTLHLNVIEGFPDHEAVVIGSVDWTTTDSIRPCPSCCNPFQHLSNLHLELPATTSESRKCDLSSSPSSGTLKITFSAQGISIFDDTDPASTSNRPTVNDMNRAIVINYIRTVMGDGYFGPIHHSIVGGINSTNHVHS